MANILGLGGWIYVTQKKKPLDFSRGFCITGGSGEIRTRDQRIKRRQIVFEQLLKH